MSMNLVTIEVWTDETTEQLVKRIQRNSKCWDVKVLSDSNSNFPKENK